jgi:hypothetical protein
MNKTAKIKMLHKISQRGNRFVTKEEKPDILCSNKVNHGFSSLVFEDSGKTTDQLLYEYARLFVDSLYDELKYESGIEESSHLLQSVHQGTGR